MVLMCVIAHNEPNVNMALTQDVPNEKLTMTVVCATLGISEIGSHCLRKAR